MKNKIKSMLLACTMTIACLPFSWTSANATTPDYSLWDKFIKYDLCITDYDSLTDTEKDLCRFIFDTEQASNDNIICERARRTLAHDENIGERITLEQLENAYGIWDNYSIYKNGWQTYIHCVPDVIRLGDGTYSNSLATGISEYWLDDDGSTYVVFNEKTSSDDIRSFDVFDKNGEFLKNIPSAMPECPYKDFRGNAEYMDKFGFSEKNGGYYYTKSDGTAVFAWSNYTYTASNSSEPVITPFVVESEINGCPVTAIENSAFASSPLTTIILPDTIEVIDYNAFYGCIYLNEIKLPKNLKYLGKSAFINCTSLNSITINCPKLRLKEDTFFDCNNLKSMDINVREIGERSLPPALESVNLGEDIEKIDFKAFSICKNLSSCEIPTGVKILCQGAFIKSGVKSVTIPPTVQIIGAYPQKTGRNFTSGIESQPARIPLTDDPICSFDSDCTINGWYGTEAHSYAIEWGLKFNPLDENIAYGDLNADNSIDIADAVLMYSYISGHEVTVGFEADLTKDGIIDTFDMAAMRRNLTA